MKFCTQQQILNWMNVTWSKMKKLHWTDSDSTEGISCLTRVWRFDGDAKNYRPTPEHVNPQEHSECKLRQRWCSVMLWAIWYTRLPRTAAAACSVAPWWVTTYRIICQSLNDKVSEKPILDPHLDQHQNLITSTEGHPLPMPTMFGRVRTTHQMTDRRNDHYSASLRGVNTTIIHHCPQIPDKIRSLPVRLHRLILRRSKQLKETQNKRSK